MITLRRGKAKTLLESSINCTLTAVETYNRPRTSFRLENYIVLMVMAWTKLFHAYFQATIGDKYYYKEKGRYKKIDGEKKAWELKECLRKYQFYNPTDKLSDAVCANLELFIAIRNKIEHRYWDGDVLDLTLFGECQSLLFNYENLVIRLFGPDYSLNTALAFSLQFSFMRSPEQLKAQRRLLSTDMQDIKRYIDKYKTDLPQEIFDSQEYSIKFIQIPKVSNTSRSDLSVEFVRWDALSEKDIDSYKRITTIIKDKIITQKVSNFNLLRPSRVIEAVKEKSGITISQNNHMLLWKSFRIRPEASSDSKFETIDKFCIYDEPHNDYLYTEEWVNFIVLLIQKYGFTRENIREKCKVPLNPNDFTL